MFSKDIPEFLIPTRLQPMTDPRIEAIREKGADFNHDVLWYGIAQDALALCETLARERDRWRAIVAAGPCQCNSGFTDPSRPCNSCTARKEQQGGR